MQNQPSAGMEGGPEKGGGDKGGVLFIKLLTVSKPDSQSQHIFNPLQMSQNSKVILNIYLSARQLKVSYIDHSKL